MNNKQIDEAIKHLQSSIKRRSEVICHFEDQVHHYKIEANKYDGSEYLLKQLWRNYHNSKYLRNLYVQEQIAEKNMLKLLYSLQNGYQVLVSLAQDPHKRPTINF